MSYTVIAVGMTDEQQRIWSHRFESRAAAEAAARFIMESSQLGDFAIEIIDDQTGATFEFAQLKAGSR